MRICRLLFTVLVTLVFQNTFSQKTFALTIVLDDSIDSKTVTCSYDNGKKDVFITDSFINKTLKIKGKFYSKLVSFHISYSKNSSMSYWNDFFINEGTSKICFTFPSNNENGLLKYDTIVNAKPIYDTINNKIWKELLEFREKEAIAVSDLWRKHGSEINRNDSFSLLNRKLFRELNNRSLIFLKKYPQHYFSFWYFRKQIVASSIVNLEKDTTYLKGLIVYFKSTFPEKYIKSVEGIELIATLDELIHPPLLNMIAPQFILKDLNGTKVQLSNFKGKYVLLDFWASWCLPCRINNPILKEINDRYKKFNFELISISLDENMESWRAAISKDEMSWLNLSDLKGLNSQNALKYKIHAIPSYILIDPSGRIVMRNVNEISKVRARLEDIFNMQLIQGK